MKKYLIFDLDGTLISSNEAVKNTVIQYLVKNFHADEENIRYILSQTRGTGLKKQIQRILDCNSKKAGKIGDIIYEKKNK